MTRRSSNKISSYYAKIDDKTGYIVLARLIKTSNETKQALEDLKIKEPKESC
jgi:hypothetical protein